MTRADLLQQSCRHLEQAATPERIAQVLTILSDWEVEHDQLVRSFCFTDYHQTLAFVNAIATLIHQQDHHPELVVGYNRCTVRYNTHSVNHGKGGLSENDFICAAKIDDIYAHHFC